MGIRTVISVFLIFLFLVPQTITAQVYQFWGTTATGGSNHDGVIFSTSDSGTNIRARHNFFSASAYYPESRLLLFNNKLYGLTGNGGNNNQGTLYAYDPAAASCTTLVHLDYTTGNYPSGALIVYNNKLYGMALAGGVYDGGTIFVYDPATGNYTVLYNFYLPDGIIPQGTFLVHNNKFYGLTLRGGIDDLGAYQDNGVLFEFDPQTNIYSKKVVLNGTNGRSPVGSLIEDNGKLYGMTSFGGSNNDGALYEFNPATGNYTVRVNFDFPNGALPEGDLVVFNNKMYGLAQAGGANSDGVIFEYDPSTNTYTKKIDLHSPTTGYVARGTLTVHNNKLYGVAQAGGTYNAGTIFEYDPLTNVFNKTADFNDTNGKYPLYMKLLVMPAPVSNGNPGYCLDLVPVVIDNTNNNEWVAITDSLGDVIAEIKANGNNLGIIATSVYIHNGLMREDNAGKLYTDRNITITSQFQPSSTVDLRLYLKNTEFIRLKNASNTYGQPSGVNTIDDIGVYKNNDDCSNTITFLTEALPTSDTAYGSDYILTSPVNSFSTFHFAKKSSAVLPVNVVYFNGEHTNGGNLLRWKLECSSNGNIVIEKSTDGRNFVALGTVLLNTVNCTQLQLYNDPVNKGRLYYRLRIEEDNGSVYYSKTIVISSNKEALTISSLPNPVSDKLKLKINADHNQRIEINLINAIGQKVKHKRMSVLGGYNEVIISVMDLPAGIYRLSVVSDVGFQSVLGIVKE